MNNDEAFAMKLLILAMVFPVIWGIVKIGTVVVADISITSEAKAARQLTPEQKRIQAKRIAKKRAEAVKQYQSEELQRSARLKQKRKEREQSRYKDVDQMNYSLARQTELVKMAQEKSNVVTLDKGGKHSETIAFYHSKLEGKKTEVKKLLAEIKGLQIALNQLVQEKIQVEPNVDLSRLLFLSDPNYIDDPNVVTIDIVEDASPTTVKTEMEQPTFNSAPVETEKEALFIDLKARD